MDKRGSKEKKQANRRQPSQLIVGLLQDQPNLSGVPTTGCYNQNTCCHIDNTVIRSRQPSRHVFSQLDFFFLFIALSWDFFEGFLGTH